MDISIQVLARKPTKQHPGHGCLSGACIEFSLYCSRLLPLFAKGSTVFSNICFKLLVSIISCIMEGPFIRRCLLGFVYVCHIGPWRIGTHLPHAWLKFLGAWGKLLDPLSVLYLDIFACEASKNRDLFLLSACYLYFPYDVDSLNKNCAVYLPIYLMILLCLLMRCLHQCLLRIILLCLGKMEKTQLREGNQQLTVK